MAKGSASSCCCTSCETMPFSNPAEAELPPGGFDPEQRITFKGHPIDYVQGFCCTCLPTNVCVTVKCLTTGKLTVTYMSMVCVKKLSANGDAEVYSGDLIISGVAHKAYFTLDVSDDFKCYFCLEIPSLSWPKQCVLITDSHLVPPLMWCKTLTYEIEEDGERIPTTFTGATYGCDDLVIKINVADVQAITGRPKQLKDIYGTVAPHFEVGRLYYDDNSIANRCKGCGCISNRACITIYRVYDGTSDSYPMNLGCANCTENCTTGHIYSTELGDYGPLVSIEKDPSCEPYDPSCPCVLQLLQLSNDHVLTDVYSEVIEKGTDAGDCPFPLQRWQIENAEGDVTIIDFRTERCSIEPCTVNPGGCCTGIEMPNVVHVTIEKVADYVSQSCECLPQTIPMLFDGSPINPSWTGRYSTSLGAGSWCNGAEHDFKVRLFCGGNSWSFQWGAGEGYVASPCAGSAMSSPTDFSCRPVYFRFEADGRCCGPSGFPDGMGGVIPAGPQTLIFTITE